MTEITIKDISNKKLKLRKDYQILVPYQFIEERIDKKISEIQKNYRLQGFRVGQVPAKIIKEKYEHSIMAEESEKIINETSRKIIDENKFKLALAPKIEIKVFEPKKDFEYSAVIELFPEVPEIDFDKIKLTKREAEISKPNIDESISKILKHHRKWNKQDESHKARKGDAVNIDYVGRIDKEVFDGGSATGYQLELGSKSFIDDFEEQLVGKKAGDNVRVKVRFPKTYHQEKFADKKAEFEVKINFVLTTETPELNDEFVKNNFGLENLTKLEEVLKQQMESSYKNLSRGLFKKDLFEFLNKKYDFDLPTGLVDEQFNKIWLETEEELKENPGKFKAPKELEKAKEKERESAEKMVRTGIIFSSITQKNKITVSREDLNEEINKKLFQFPGQEEMVTKFYQKNPEAVENLRSAALEEKVINFIIEKSRIENKKISVKDFDKISKNLS